MPISTEDNPGKYDDLCTEAREKANAKGAVLIILDGNKGKGFSVQLPFDDLLRLPELLEIMAKEIRRDLKSQMNNQG